MSTSKGTKYTLSTTVKAIEAWMRKAERDTEMRVDKGLYLHRTSGGARWVFRYLSPVTGKQCRVDVGLGDPRGSLGFPDRDLEDARTRATALRALVGAKKDPQIQADEARQAAARAADTARLEDEARLQAAADALAAAGRRLSVLALFEQWVKVELQPRIGADGRRTGRKDGGQYLREQFGRHVFPALGDRAVADVRKSDLMVILDTSKSAGKLRTANVLLAALKQMFRFALVREIVERNPLDTVTKRDAGGTDAMRERVLAPDEIKALPALIADARMNRRSVAAIWLLLSTGARIGELMGAAWVGADLTALAALPEAADVKVGAVDVVAGTWYLPTTKNEREHTIHLSAFALEQFKVLAALRGAGPWVFPDRAGAGPLDIKSFGKQLADRQRDPTRRLSGRSKATSSLVLPGGRWTAHDLRRTAGTLMAGLGISGDVIDEALNHIIESSVRRTYIRDRRPVEQARAFDALGARLTEIISGAKAPANVVPLHGKAA